jgi:hypothetical protein
LLSTLEIEKPLTIMAKGKGMRKILDEDEADPGDDPLDNSTDSPHRSSAPKAESSGFVRVSDATKKTYQRSRRKILEKEKAKREEGNGEPEEKTHSTKIS